MDIPGNTYRITWSFLTERQVHNEDMDVAMVWGCPQGSSLWPTLWLYRKQPLIKMERRHHHLVQSKQNKRTFREAAEPVAMIPNCRATRNKAELLLTTRRLHNETGRRGGTSGPRLSINEERIRPRKAIGYLEWIIDEDLTVVDHDRTMWREAQEVTNKLAVIAWKRWDR